MPNALTNLLYASVCNVLRAIYAWRRMLDRITQWMHRNYPIINAVVFAVACAFFAFLWYKSTQGAN